MPEKGLGEYRRTVQVHTGEGSERVPKKGLGEYRRLVQVSTGEGSRRVL